MNSKKAPKTTKNIKTGNIKPLTVRLKNSVPLYVIQAGSQPVIRMDITFNAGSWYQSTPLAASSVAAMLTEGTSRYSGKEIAEKLDYHGAYLNTSSNRDNAFVTAYFLEKHKNTIIPMLAELINDPVFPEHEFQVYKERRRQSFIIEKSKVDNLAREKFANLLYGPLHPYGQSLTSEDFDNITREDLITFHSRYYIPGNCSIIISGKYNDDELISIIDRSFGNPDPSNIIEAFRKIPEKIPSPEKQVFIAKKDAVQSALRIGREFYNRAHPDYAGMMVLNNILGGHFGSRLMQNIREKKGYTYGIGSAMVTLRNSGFFVIMSEVGARYRQASVKEIYKEMDKLCSKPVSKKELELNRTQMMGDILRGFDGPFAWAESIRNLTEHGLETDFYEKMTETILHIDPPQLLDLAVKYLLPAKMYEVVAGAEKA